MKHLVCSLLMVMLFAVNVVAHDGNTDVMSVETKITFPDKAPIVLKHKANHLGEGATLDKLVTGKLGFPYPCGAIVLTESYGGIKAGEHRLAVVNEGGTLYLQVGGSRTDKGTRLPMSLSTVSDVVDHMQIAAVQAEGKASLTLEFAYGKYRSAVTLGAK
jgi:hypothetical protein